MVEGSCCFCGWRQPPAGGWGLPEGAREGEVLGLAAAGVTRFLCGGTPGFDTLAARAVLRARAVRPEVRLVLVLPCGGITWGWRPGEVEALREVAEGADLGVELAERYFPGCIQRQGRYLVEHSGSCLCWFPPGGRGGWGRQMAAYARSRGLTMLEPGKGTAPDGKTAP